MGRSLDSMPPHLRKLAEAAIRKQSSRAGSVRGRSWSAAVPTDADGIRFGSKMEARVYRRLASIIRDGERLFCQVRLPLLCLGPGDKLRPESYLTVDFAITRGGRLYRLIDAKMKSRTSRDWDSRAAACRETWGIEIEEVEN